MLLSQAAWRRMGGIFRPRRRALVFSLPIQLPSLKYLLVTSTQGNCGIPSRELVHANFSSMDLNNALEEEENNNCGIHLNIPILEDDNQHNGTVIHSLIIVATGALI
jgi:hypothetical protein